MEPKNYQISSNASPTQKSIFEDVIEEMLSMSLENVEDEMFGKARIQDKKEEVKNHQKRNREAKFISELNMEPTSFLNLKSEAMNLGPKPKYAMRNKTSFTEGAMNSKFNARKRLLFTDSDSDSDSEDEQCKKIRI